MATGTALAQTFSRSANAYNSSAVLQRQIAKRLILTADPSFRPQSVVDLGAGTGFLTAELQRSYPHAEIDAVDISAGMLDCCRNTVAYGGGVRLHLADAREFRGECAYDLLATSSALQWMQPLGATLLHFRSLLAPEGRFLGAVMLASTLGELRGLRRELFPQKTVNEILPGSADLMKVLREAGFLVRNYVEDWHDERYPTARALLEYVSAVGISGPVEIGSKELLSRAELELLCREYDSRYGDGTAVKATYHIAYFEAEGITASRNAKGENNVCE